MMTSIHTMPMVSGTNRKWYIAVAANCSRDRSTSCSLTMGSPDVVCSFELAGATTWAAMAPGSTDLRVADEGPPQRGDEDQLEDDDEGDLADEAAVGGVHGGLRLALSPYQDPCQCGVIVWI
jgi:hypothetical protein